MIIEWAGPKKIGATPLMKKRVSCRQDIGLLISSSTQCGNFMILREIKIGDAGVLKMPFFAILKTLNVDFLVNFRPSKKCQIA